jgi:hypothetical protein
MLGYFSLKAAIATLVAIAAWQGYAAYRAHKHGRSKAPDSRSSVPNRIVRRVIISPTTAADIFERSGGSFGFVLLTRVVDEDGERWLDRGQAGHGSAFDTPAHAEEHARRAAVGGA